MTLQSFFVWAQFDVEIPPKVMSVFMDKYEHASIGSWESIEGKYRVFYDFNQKFNYIIYDANAVVLESGIFADKSVVPANLVDMFLHKLNLLQHTETYLSTTAKGVAAFLLVGEDEENKHEMLVTDKGQIIRTYKQPLLTQEQKAELRKKMLTQDPKKEKIQW